MKKVLILSYVHPPCVESGAQRIARAIYVNTTHWISLKKDFDSLDNWL